MSSSTKTSSSSSAAGANSEVSSSGTSAATSPPSTASSWYGGAYPGAPSPYPGYPPSPQQAGAYPGYAQWQSYPAYPGYGNYAGWDYNSGTGVPPSPGSASNPLPTPPPPPPSTTSSKSSKDGSSSSKSSSSKLPQPPPLPPLPPPAFALPPPPPPGPPPTPSSTSAPSSAEPPKKEKESREERKKRKKEKKKKEREEREREKERKARHDKEKEKPSTSVDGVPTVKSYATILKESSSSKEKDRSDSKGNKTPSSSKESSAADESADGGNVLFPPPDFSRPPPPPPPLPSQDAKQESGKDATSGGHPPLQPPPLPPQSALGGGAPYNAFDLNVPPPGFPPSPGFPPPKHGYPPMGPPGGPPGAPGGPPGPYGYPPNWYPNSNNPRGPPGPDDLRGGNDAGPYGPGGPYHHPRDGSHSPYGNSKPGGGGEGGNNSRHPPPHHGQSPFEPHHSGPGNSGPGHIKFNFQQKNNFNKQNALLETPPTKPQWNLNRPPGSAGGGPERGEFGGRGGMFRDGPMDMEQGRDGPRGPNRRNLNSWRDEPHAEGQGMGRGGPGMGRGGPGMGRDAPLMEMDGPGLGRGAPGVGGRDGPPVRPEESLFGSSPGKVPSKDSLAKSSGQSNLTKSQQSQKDMVSMMKGDWPDTLKRYVERCFAKCVTDLDKDQVEIVLKGKLTAAAKTGSLWTHNWDTESVPNVHSDSMFKSIRNRFPTRGSEETKDKESPEKRPNDFGRGGGSGNMSRGGGGMGRGGSTDSIRVSEGRDGDKRGGRHHGGGRNSRSRSRSPYNSSSRHRRDNRRRYSRSPSEDTRGPSISGNSNNSNFLPVGGGGGGPNNFRGQKRGRGGRGGSMSSRLGQMGNKESEQGGAKDKENAPGTNAYGGPNEDFFDLTSPPKQQPNKKMKMDGSGKEKDPRNDIYFYSKGGKMTLDADLATDAHLQKRAARFHSMMGGSGGGSAPAPAPAPAPRGGRGGRGGQQSGKRGRGRGGRGATTAATPISSATPSIVSTINASLFSVDTGDMDWAAMHVVGTCTEVKKQYLRLTSAPDPGTVRTLATLYKSLDFVKKDWIEKKDYRYTCNQMKSIRQDLTVQGVRDNFTIQVYEAHCRIALETADHEEFNQCQSQLKQLYSELPGAPNSLEFTAYRLLYYIYTKNTLDMTSLMAELTTKHKSDECIAFALNLRAAWAMSNYCKFFKLFQKAPKMAGYLVDWFTERERKIAIKIMVKGYRPGSVSTEYVKSQLAVTADEWAKLTEAIGLQYTDRTRTSIDCKATVLAA